jgi:hypothetical protein
MVIVPYVSFTIDGENRYIELIDFCDKNKYIFVVLKLSIFTPNPIVDRIFFPRIVNPSLEKYHLLFIGISFSRVCV